MSEMKNMTTGSPSKPWFGRIAVILGIIGLFVLVFWLAMKSRRMLAKPAKLAVDEQNLSFGAVWEDTAFDWTLPIRNTTNEDIEIIDFRANCSCAKIEPRSLKIPAQQTKQVRLTLNLRPPYNEPTPQNTLPIVNSSGRSSPAETSSPFAVKVIPVFPNGLDPREGWEIHGRVRVPVELEPTSLSFEYLETEADRTPSQEVRIKCLGDLEKITPKYGRNLPTVRVVKDANLNDQFKLTDTFRLDVRPSPTLSAGKHRFAIELQLRMRDTHQNASVQIPVSVEVKSEYYWFPSIPNWGAVEIGELSTESFQLRSRSGKNFSIEKIISGSPNIKVIPLDGESSSAHTFRVECLFGDPGEHIEKVDFLIKEENGRLNASGGLERVSLKIKCQVF